jgi:hypothetical protein
VKAPRGFVARALAGRVDRTILGDIGVLAGAGLFTFGLWQYSHPSAWLFAGAALVAVSVLAMLPAKKIAPRSLKGDA